MSTSKQPSPFPIEHLRAVPGLRSRDDDELAELARLVDETEVPAGAVLLSRRLRAGKRYVILEGWAAVTVHGEPVAALGPGQFIGETTLAQSDARAGSVVAKTPMRLLTVPADVVGSVAPRQASDEER